jgi:hypothetical protein
MVLCACAITFQSRFIKAERREKLCGNKERVNKNGTLSAPIEAKRTLYSVSMLKGGHFPMAD